MDANQKKLEGFAPNEVYAYKKFLERGQRPGDSSTYAISERTAEELFAVFLTGRSCDDIRRLNFNKYTLGQIVDAAIRYDWVAKRAAYYDLVVARAKMRANLAACEGAELVADLMAALKKKYGDNLARYIQSGDESDVTGLSSEDFRELSKDLRQIVELLSRVTGQDQKKTVRLQFESLPHVPSADAPIPEPSDDAQLLAELAAQARARLAEKL